MKLILLIIFSIKLLESIKVTDLCQKKEVKGNKPACQNIYNFNCDSNLCAKYQSSCQTINSLFRAKNNFYRYEKDFILYSIQYKSFLEQIKECPKTAEYKWKPNDVCLNTKDCVNTFITIWSLNQIKKRECKCIGKYSYRCNSDYCALNKQACDGLKNKKSKYKKCNKQN
jgi:hypothetical protein